MNYLKWLVCWYNKALIFCRYYTKEGKAVQKCIRCGYETWYGSSK